MIKNYKNTKRAFFFLMGLVVGMSVTSAFAEESPMESRIQHEISLRYPKARIQILGPIKGNTVSDSFEIQKVELGAENGRGEVAYTADLVSAAGESQKLSGFVKFSAWMPARVVTRRVLPGQKVMEDAVETKEVLVSQAPLREMKGLILDPSIPLERIEARQTLLEGQPILSSAVQKSPDVRRGDAIRVEIRSNSLSVMTSGIVEEPAYLQGQVRVMTGKSKREMQGRLISSDLVEVKL